MAEPPADQAALPFDFKQAGLDLVQAALDPDEGKFFKKVLGRDSPELSDWLFPTGRFDRARKQREWIRQLIAHGAVTAWGAEMQRRGLRQPSGAPQGFLEYQDAETAKENAVRAEQGGLAGSGFLGGYTPNAYGPGMNADATGRPFVWQPDFGGPALGQITPNAYGPGVGMDATGRPVRPACPPGWAGPC